MMDHDISRRGLVSAIGAGGLAGALPGPAASPGVTVGERVANAADLGADPRGQADSAPAIQRAIDAVKDTGGIVYFPAGTYVVGRMLTLSNEQNSRKPGVYLIGDGMHSTVLLSRIANGPILRVRGALSDAHADTSFIWGGGLHNLSLRGDGASSGQHGLDITGWYYGEIRSCLFAELGGDGIRAGQDTGGNPDTTASSLFVKGVWLERLGGWGFRDLSRMQGAPGWSWDHVVFSLCKAGGALVRSGGHRFANCSFSLCGWQMENQPPGPGPAYGLFFDGSASASSQQVVESCEFDSSRTAHIGARFLAASTIANNRFIASNRIDRNSLFPMVGVEIGSGDANAAVRGVRIGQNFFRYDIAAQAVGIDFRNTANVRDVEIAGTVFSYPPEARIVRYRNNDPKGQGRAFGFVVKDYELPDLARPS